MNNLINTKRMMLIRVVRWIIPMLLIVTSSNLVMAQNEHIEEITYPPKRITVNKAKSGKIIDFDKPAYLIDFDGDSNINNVRSTSKVSVEVIEDTAFKCTNCIGSADTKNESDINFEQIQRRGNMSCDEGELISAIDEKGNAVCVAICLGSELIGL